MVEGLREQVANRANRRCEHCRLPERCSALAFEVEHIIAQKHGGQTLLENLAYACRYCNAYKGSNIAGIGPSNGEVVPLFHPRRADWGDHFRWDGPELTGLTVSGRATIEVLRINHPEMIALRSSLLAEGVEF
jgi:hypothetical protein